MTLICWLAFSFVLWTVNPEATNWLGFLLFYSSLFLSIVGTSAIIGFIIRFVGLKHELAFRSVRDAFRQSFLLAFLIVAILFLLSKNLFSWLNVFFLIVGLSVLEFFLISYQRPYLLDNKIDENEKENF
jgi:hypothetical protein